MFRGLNPTATVITSLRDDAYLVVLTLPLSTRSMRAASDVAGFASFLRMSQSRGNRDAGFYSKRLCPADFTRR